MEILYQFYLLILTISFCVGLLLVREFSHTLRLILIYVLITLIVEILGYYSLELSSSKLVNINLYNIYALLYLGLLSLYFHALLDKINKSKFLTFMTIIFALYFFSQILYYLNNYNQIKVNFRLILAANFILSLYSFLYFRQILKIDNLFTSEPNFWIVTGILFYNVGTFFLFGLITFVSLKNVNLAQKLYSINHVLNIIYYSLITYGFICQRRLAKSSL